MAASNFTDAALHAHLDAGHSQADAARHFGVSEAAIHQRLKRMRRLTSQVVALERANDIVDEKLSATARLERVQRVIDEELAWAVQEARRDGGDRSALADVILKLAGEVRQQLGLQLSISVALTWHWHSPARRRLDVRQLAAWSPQCTVGDAGTIVRRYDVQLSASDASTLRARRVRRPRRRWR
jgi:hypothetical protein